MCLRNRSVQGVLLAQLESDGAGVRLKRAFDRCGLARFDPFLVSHEFGSEEDVERIGGFPSQTVVCSSRIRSKLLVIASMNLSFNTSLSS